MKPTQNYTKAQRRIYFFKKISSSILTPYSNCYGPHFKRQKHCFLQDVNVSYQFALSISYKYPHPQLHTNCFSKPYFLVLLWIYLKNAVKIASIAKIVQAHERQHVHFLLTVGSWKLCCRNHLVTIIQRKCSEL